MSDLNIFFNTRFECQGDSLGVAGAVGRLGDWFLTPVRYLFDGNKITFSNNKGVLNPVNCENEYSISGANPKNKPTKNFLRTTAFIILLLPGTIIGAAFKGLCYLSSLVRQRHNLAVNLLSNPNPASNPNTQINRVDVITKPILPHSQIVPQNNVALGQPVLPAVNPHDFVDETKQPVLPNTNPSDQVEETAPPVLTTPIAPITQEVLSPAPYHLIKDDTLFIPSANEMTPSVFWKTMEKFLNSDEQWKQLEIEGFGQISRTNLDNCLKCDVQLAPERLISWNQRMDEQKIWNKLLRLQTNLPLDNLFSVVITGRIDKIDFNELKKLIELKELHPDVTDQWGCTLLHLASFLGHHEIVDNLLDLGADINSSDNEPFPAIVQALWANDLKMMELLIDKGANINFVKNNENLLILTAEENNLEAMKLIIDQVHDLNKYDDDGYTALHFAAENGNLDMINLLISKKADLNIDVCAYSPLSIAAIGGNIDAVNLLIKNKAKKITSLEYASEVRRALLDSQPDAQLLFELISDVPFEIASLFEEYSILKIKDLQEAIEVYEQIWKLKPNNEARSIYERISEVSYAKVIEAIQDKDSD